MVRNGFSFYWNIIDVPKYLSIKYFFHGPGIIAWTIHGYINKDKAVLTNFALQIPFSVIGFYKYFFM